MNTHVHVHPTLMSHAIMYTCTNSALPPHTPSTTASLTKHISAQCTHKNHIHMYINIVGTHIEYLQHVHVHVRTCICTYIHTCTWQKKEARPMYYAYYCQEYTCTLDIVHVCIYVSPKLVRLASREIRWVCLRFPWQGAGPVQCRTVTVDPRHPLPRSQPTAAGPGNLHTTKTKTQKRSILHLGQLYSSVGNWCIMFYSFTEEETAGSVCVCVILTVWGTHGGREWFVENVMHLGTEGAQEMWGKTTCLHHGWNREGISYM